MLTGFHADVTDENIKIALENNIRVLQFMPGGRISYKCPDASAKMRKLVDNKLLPLFHAPLCCFCVSDKVQVRNLTLLYLRELDSEVKKAFGPGVMCRVVVHAGASEDPDYESILKSFVNRFLYSTSSLVLCIENDAGSKKGTKIGSVDFLVDFCRRNADSRLKVCVDTNHSWGHPKEEFDVTDMSCWDNIQDVLGVIHYNCIPDICERYGMLDRHSTNLLEESGESTKWLIELYKRNYSVPYITERSSVELSVKDYKWVRSM